MRSYEPKLQARTSRYLRQFLRKEISPEPSPKAAPSCARRAWQRSLCSLWEESRFRTPDNVCRPARQESREFVCSRRIKSKKSFTRCEESDRWMEAQSLLDTARLAMRSA